MAFDSATAKQPEILQKTDISSSNDVMHLENIETNDNLNIHYDEVDEEPELHMRTYIAIAAVCVMNLVQTIAVQGPPAAVRHQNSGSLGF